MARSLRRHAAVVIAVIVAVIVGWLGLGLVVPVGGGGRAVRFTLRRGDSAHQVALRLKSAGLLRSATAFRLAAAWRGGWTRAHAGAYALRPDMSARDLLRAFERGDVIAEWITIPEGYTVSQMADAFQAKGLGTADEFLRAARGGDAAGAPVAPGASLEGYLFPDTYKVAAGADAAQGLVSEMLARFNEVVRRGLFHGQADGRALHDTIILASLVEAEAKVDAERPVIAGVLRNRLKIGMKLQCDATVQYARGPGNRAARLTYDDLEIASPYNTYLYAGLPPGPINSPGRRSIAAALHPATVPYLFYVARPDGTHIFSRTGEEHQRAKARLRALRLRNGNPRAAGGAGARGLAAPERRG